MQNHCPSTMCIIPAPALCEPEVLEESNAGCAAVVCRRLAGSPLLIQGDGSRAVAGKQVIRAFHAQDRQRLDGLAFYGDVGSHAAVLVLLLLLHCCGTSCATLRHGR